MGYVKLCVCIGCGNILVLCTYVLYVIQVMGNLMRGDLEINKSIGLVYVQLKIVGTIVVLWVQL